MRVRGMWATVAAAGVIVAVTAGPAATADSEPPAASTDLPTQMLAELAEEDNWGGAWLDDLGVLHLAFAGQPNPRAERLIGQMSPPVAFEVESVRTPLQKLEAVEDEISSQFDTWREQGHLVELVGASPPLNRVRIGVSSPVEPAGDFFESRFDSELLVIESTAPIESIQVGDAACWSRFACFPLRGGIELIIPTVDGPYGCSSGFVVELRADPSQRGILTNGHCAFTGEVVEHAGVPIGTVAHSYLGNTGPPGSREGIDIAVIDLNPGVSSEPWYYRTDATRATGVTGMAAQDDHVIGLFIGKSGYGSDRTDGNITGVVDLLSADRNGNPVVVDDMVETDVCAVAGDSGAAVYRGGVAYGLMSNSADSNDDGDVTEADCFWASHRSYYSPFPRNLAIDSERWRLATD